MQGPPGPPGPRGPPGVKGAPGQSISTPSLLQRPVETTVNASQTAILKCTAVGNPPPKVTWFKVNSSLPVGRHVVESSGALILQDARPGDEGQYTCKAENLLGTINASARLTVQCKLHFILQDFKMFFYLSLIHFLTCCRSILTETLQMVPSCRSSVSLSDSHYKMHNSLRRSVSNGRSDVMQYFVYRINVFSTSCQLHPLLNCHQIT